MIRAIIVGAGRIALSHLPHIQNHPDVELVAIVEPNRISRFVIHRLSKIKVVPSLDDIDRSCFDAAFILTPPQTHFDIGKSLIDDYKHVFVEKPLTLDATQSERLIDAAKIHRIQLSVGYVYRFHPIYNKVRTVIDSGIYGPIQSANIKMSGNVVSEKAPKSWRNSGLGAGCLFDYGCHAIDLSLFLFGRPYNVQCLEKEEFFRRGVVDKFLARLEYRDEPNFDAGIFCNWSDTTVRKAGIIVELDMLRHSLWSDGQLIQVRGDDDLDYSIKDLDTDVPYYLRGEEFQRQLDVFVAGIKQEEKNYDYAEDAVLCDEIISKLHECAL
jgi:scyllo-inositol 2-dehydrogenase (NADP+)